MKFSMILAVDSNYGIGKNNNLPWHLPDDLQYFKNITYNPLSEIPNAVVMGHKTFQTFKKPLIGRIHYVLSSSNQESTQQVKFFNSWELLLDQLRKDYYNKCIHKVFFIGGKTIYEKGIELGCNKIYMTRIDYNYECDTFINIDLSNYTLIKQNKKHTTNDIQYEYLVYKFNGHPEYQYLQLLEEVLYTGEERSTRNAITYSLFGKRLEFDISQSFPLLTTKKVFYRGIVEELLWFLRGDTNAKHLEDKGVKIWNGNSSREYLDKYGLSHYQEGDCGPVYGFQWRHFNAPYSGCNSDYTGQGIDQFGECIRLLKEDPTNRRIFFSGWNPIQMKEMVLPPCHLSYQFYVDNQNRITCQMYQRSADLFLGVPFNIASVATLVHIMSYYTGKKPGKVIICFGDCHIYKDHYDAVQKQLINKPKEWCQLELINLPEKLEDLQYENFKIHNYESYGTISAKMIA